MNYTALYLKIYNYSSCSICYIIVMTFDIIKNICKYNLKSVIVLEYIKYTFRFMEIFLLCYYLY
jgi:hypothetical protein